MTTKHPKFTLEIWGDYACFTRPETKVERLSYPVITPSAARGFFDSIFCNRHRMWWQIRQIEVLNDPKFIALRRNEVKGKVPSDRTIASWMKGTALPEPLWADGTDEGTGRTQRQTIALKNVRYRVTAELRTWPGFENQLEEFKSKFVRKARAGQCLFQPYLGCREFVWFFELIEEAAPLPSELNLDIGWMIYDVFRLDEPGTNVSRPSISLFHADVVSGVLQVPEYSSPLVRKPEVRRA
jgi:CRISPR-associated protein Cas5d